MSFLEVRRMEETINISNIENDHYLVIKARGGDQKAYEALVCRYEETIYFKILQMVYDKVDARDLTSETFAKAFTKLEKFQPDHAFSTWLFRVATNTCIDFLRRKKRIQTTSLQSMIDVEKDEMSATLRCDELNPEQALIKKQNFEKLKQMIDGLPAHYRDLIKLRYFEELLYEEIATQLNLTLGNVKSGLYRARQWLINNSSRFDIDSFC